MPAYFEYALKSSLCLAVIFLFYTLLLRRMTYYTWNRYFLLIYCVLACVIPFMNVNVFIEANQFSNIAFFDQLPSLPAYAVTKNKTSDFPGLNITSLLAYVFIFGVCLMTIRLFIQLLSLWKMHLKATLLQDGKIKIYHLAERIIPFSYFNNIYLNKDNYSGNELAEIVKHELVHVQQKHAVDILITEIICILNWYNPIAWLLKKAVKENLEFIADDAVIKKGTDKKNYQYLLLKVTGDVSFSIANNLNFLSLKNRISMMNKTKSNRVHLLKFILIIPIATALLLAFRNKNEVFTGKHTKYAPAIKTYILSSLTYTVPDKKVEAVVKSEQDRCLIKTGQTMSLDLDMFLREHDRLKDILEKSGYNLEKDGYNNLGKYGIIFMIDTTLGNNNFSVEVNINLTRNHPTQSKEELSEDRKISAPVSNTERSTNTAKPVLQSFNVQPLDNKDEAKIVSVNRSFNSNLFMIK